jgi:hypothetical protein
LPKTIITVYIDLSNGEGVEWGEEEQRRFESLTEAQQLDFVEKFLGVRVAARGLFSCNFKALCSAVNEEQEDWLNLLKFSDVIRTMAKINHATTEEPVGVLLILDEINYLFKSQSSLVKKIINLIGNFMVGDTGSKQREVGAVIFPVISGTAVNAVKKSFLDSAYSSSIVSIGFLSFDSACAIFKHCLPSKKHWLDDKRIRRVLLLYGNTPAVLRSIITASSDLRDQLTEKLFDSLVEGLDGKVN